MSGLPVIVPPNENAGAPYPRLGPNSAALGTFVPGDPLAMLPLLNPWTDEIISQYANSPALTQIICSFFASVDVTQWITGFFDNVWNPDTANGYGLDIWGRIVGIGRVLTMTEAAYLAFEQSGAPGVGWSQGPFYSGRDITYNYRLNDQTYRNLIFAKALANISDGSIKSMNHVLLTMFRGRGNCWVQDGGIVPYFGFEQNPESFGFDQAPFYSGGRIFNRSIAYVLTWNPTAVDVGLIGTGVIPKPIGIPYSIKVV